MALRGIFWIQLPWRNPSVRCSDPQELLHSFLPLVAAVNARAIPFNGPILPAGNPTCAAMDSRAGVSCVSGASNSSPAGQSGVEGVALGTSSMIAFLNGGIATLTVSASGPLVNAGIPTGTTIPLNYVFSLSFQNGGTGATVTGWSLDFDLLDGSSIIGNSGAIDGVPTDTSLSTSEVFPNTATMTTSAAALAGDTLTETVTLSVTWNRGGSRRVGGQRTAEDFVRLPVHQRRPGAGHNGSHRLGIHVRRLVPVAAQEGLGADPFRPLAR